MESLQSQIPITFIDVDISTQTAQNHNVRSVPTTILLEDGVEIGRLTGIKPKEEIISLYNR
jgi:thioredoxin-like negative regulator of GroEL